MIHDRKSIRLKDYDYSQKGAYFITVCTQDRTSLFGNIQYKKINLFQSGKMIVSWWVTLQEKFNNVVLDEFVVMPNHFHGIIFLVGAIHELPYRSTNEKARAVREPPLQNTIHERRNMIIPKMIGYFKMNSAKNINEYFKTPGKQVWQRNYYEHIIRNENELQRIREYIIENPCVRSLGIEPRTPTL